MPEIRSVVKARSRHFHVLFYNIKLISKYPTFDFLKRFTCLKKAIVNKWLNKCGEH